MKYGSFPIVNVTFDNDSMLIHCVIFDEEPQKGTKGLIDEDLIKRKFQKLPWYSRWDGWIYFQNKYINGCFHVHNVKNYEIKYITNEEF